MLVLVDQGWLSAAVDLAASAVAAVGRLNGHVAAIKEERRCTVAQFETGVMPTDCPKTP
ncbi:MAG: hypothetical protein M3Y22_10225 [Pseudomonadota bacterium]|nr:hypothetical protein [Pseudomonadota bacterium]